MQVRICGLTDSGKKIVSSFAGHCNPIVACFFESGSYDQKGVKLTSAFYHKKRRLLVSGHSNGSFLLHEMPDFNLIHSLNISGYAIDSVTMNSTGDWIGIASAELGQLVVWEWQSETFAMKQQGHFNKMSCLAYSPDGATIATGGYDAKVKLWNIQDGICFATFTEHTDAVTGVTWTQSGKAILSCSYDGTVRAFDLKRYRNFRTCVTPQPVQLSSVAVDVAGDLVCASGQDTFDIFIWSVQTGRLLEVLSGHEAPVSDVCFCPTESAIASCSWDKTLRIWDIAEGKSRRDVIQLNTEDRPGYVLFFMVSEWNNVQMNTIEGKFDLDPKRSDTDVITAAKSATSKSFTSIAFSPDGECLLAGGQSPFLCLYSVEQQMLLKKFKITCNRSLNAVDDDVDMRKMSEFGNIELIDASDDDELTNKSAIKLPGVRKEDIGIRSARPEVRIYSVQFSPTGTALAACTTEGLLIYSSNSQTLFDPYMLDSDVTPKAVYEKLDQQSFAEALIMALKLNLHELITMTVERIPSNEIDAICRALPEIYAQKLLRFVGDTFGKTIHVEFYLLWTHSLCVHHATNFKNMLKHSLPAITAAQQSLNRRQLELSRM
ncbi:unnamed protein product [Soboliphyme baturini]|uniref:WD_REPEATS_REGION domain-containing protein n=1 Tax=Soboliphyme baturini TaxID=241478 RepID=A0A183IRF6_9BILA|nr:unnamed protein product [Soboliphyme baturini]